MSAFSYNYYKNLSRPITYLGTPQKHIVGTILSRELQTDFYANSMDKGTFKVNRCENGEETPFYHDIEVGRYLLLYGVGWFIISEMRVVNKGINEYKELTYTSLEYELSHKYLTSFGSLGVETDDQGGLDLYSLYNKADTEHSILHIAVQKNPDWWIKYVDPAISQEYRSFQADSIDTYSFLTGDVSEAFDCIFLFDSSDKSISAYTLERLGRDTGIVLNYRNFIKAISQNASDRDVKTVLTVVGGNDARTNTPLDIIDVNIAGSNQIFDFSYYWHMMSGTLQKELIRYREACGQNEAAYRQKLTELSNLYVELNHLKSHGPDTPGSTDWTQYGLNELLAQEKLYKTNMSLYTNENDLALFSQNSRIHQAVENEIAVRKDQIRQKEAQIASRLNQVQALVVRLDEFLGDSLYKELNAYIREDTLTDDSFVVTTVMTEDEILEMQAALLEHARKELQKVCFPKIESEIDLINFTVDYDYKRFTDCLELFNILHIRLEDQDIQSDVRLLKMHVNWDNPADFKVTFSNRNSLEDSWNILKETKDQAQSTASQIAFASGAWKDAAQKSVDFTKYQNSVLDASLRQLQSSAAQEWILDETGLMLRSWRADEKIYDPCQMWLTNSQLAMTLDNWNHVSLALGHIKVGNDSFYGLNAQMLCSVITLSEQLYVVNSSGNYSITKDGMLAKNGSFQVRINPNTPSEIFSVSIDKKKLLYVDANQKKLKFEGDIESVSGHIASYVISEKTLTSGKVGMSSDTAPGAKAFWAGNVSPNLAPFWVNHAGKIHASNVEITGGTLTIGDAFSVTSKGVLTASRGVFSGTISASAINGSTITGGSLNIKNQFIVDDKGNLTARSGTFYGLIDGGTIQGSTITGGSITGSEIHAGKNWDVSDDSAYMLYATPEELHIGNFKVAKYVNRYIFESEDEWTGMSPEIIGDKSQKVSLWANYYPGKNSYDEEYDFVVSQTGNVRIKNLFVYGTADISLSDTQCWGSQTLYEALDYIWCNEDYGIQQIWSQIRELKEQVNDLENSLQEE